MSEEDEAMAGGSPAGVCCPGLPETASLATFYAGHSLFAPRFRAVNSGMGGGRSGASEGNVGVRDFGLGHELK